MALALAAALLLGAAACSAAPNPSEVTTKSAQPAAPTTSSASASAAPAPRPARPLDAQFHAYEKELPPAATLSEQNGFSIECAHVGPQNGARRDATLTLLYATSQKVTVAGDDDLVALVPWARHADPCIRHIAIQAILPAIGYDRSSLSVPNMHDPESFQFHDIFVSLRARLAEKGAAIDPALFDGMMLGMTRDEVAAFLKGKWTEDSGEKGFQLFVEVRPDTLVVLDKHVPVDPSWDSTWTTRYGAGTLNERGQYVVRGSSSVETHDGKDNPPQAPSPFVYSFWPVAKNIAWFKNGESAYWVKLRRD